MSEFKKYFFGAVEIECQTEHDRKEALATIAEKRRRFEIRSGFRRSDSKGNFLLAIGHGDYYYDQSIVEQASLRARVSGVFGWRRRLPLFNSPREFDGKFLKKSY